MTKTYLKSILLLATIAFFVSSCASTKTAKVPNYIGTWTYAIDTPQGTSEGYLTITQEEKEVVGVIGSDMGETNLSEFEVSEESVSGSFDFQGYNVLMTGTFNGNVLEGIMSVSGYDLPFTANKKVD